MDENTKNMNNPNPDGAGEKTFTQEQVNQIISERLARDRAKSEAALVEKEQQLAQRELLLNAKERINEMGLPVELLDALNISSSEALEKSLNTMKAVLEKQKSEAKPIKFRGVHPATPDRPNPNSSLSETDLRKAMGLPK